MNILLIGSGGREHALCWKLAQSPDVGKIYVAPGNPGMAAIAESVAVDVEDHAAIAALCQSRTIDLVVIGPEAPLVDGLADSLVAANIAVFGPSAKAAQLEGSKGFTKDLCARANIPTAAYVRTYNLSEARAALAEFPLPVVIKADGLAAGKGVIIAQTADEADEAVAHMFAGGFGDAGAEVVIEEFMTGEEVSFFALTDGETVLPLASAQDHKRVGDGDIGPNTGGMGAYSPAPILTPTLEQQVLQRIINPTVTAMRKDGMPYSGILYAGLILTTEGPKLIEYNCRFGDPECQVLMMRLEDDLAALLMATAKGELEAQTVPVFSDKTALTVVMAAKGYPTAPEKGGVINGVADAENAQVTIFHAGTKMQGKQLIANGGRVLNVTAMSDDISGAYRAAYAAIDSIDFASGFYRNDIGWREIERQAAP